MKIRVLQLGYGNVGSKFSQLLVDHRQELKHRWGVDLELVGIVRRNLTATKQIDVPHFTDFTEALSQTNPDVLVELMGGTDPALTWLMTALNKGVHVITANKAVLAKHGAELYRCARKNACLLLAEASVGGAVPILRTLHTALAADTIENLVGIWNGTCNFILTQMEFEQMSFAQALSKAQALGYAETDPSLDIHGTDTAHKALVMARLAFGDYIPFDSIVYRGIEDFIPSDFEIAKQMKLRPKMVGWLKKTDDELQLYIGPALFSTHEPIANLDGVMNGIEIRAKQTGAIFLAGPGAGPSPTAMTVLGDLVEVGRHILHNQGSEELPVFDRWGTQLKEDQTSINYKQIRFAYYLRFMVPDEPGILGIIATTLGKHGIGIEAMVQPNAEASSAVAIYLRVYPTEISCIEDALAAIASQGVTLETPFWMPILQDDFYAA